MFRLAGIPLLIVFSFVLLSCPSDEDKPEQFVYSSEDETGFPIPEDLMGMVHVGYYYTYNSIDKTREEEYALTDEMGIQWMLRDFSWSDIQPAENNWRLNYFDQYAEDAEEFNKNILGLLAYDVGWIHNASCGHPSTDAEGNNISRRVVAGEDEVAAFCEYARRTVSHYKDKVGAWCIWNEPNLDDRFWTGTPQEFFTLTKAAADAIREVDEDAVIVGGALNTLADDDIWTRGLFESGAMDKIDYIAYHPYLTDAVTSSNRFNSFRDYVDGCREGYGNKIWITEVGYPMQGTYGTEVAEHNMPEMVTKTITLLTVGKARTIFWYEMFDHGASGNPRDSEHWFGLIDRDTFTKKGGADGYQLCALNIPGKIWHSQYPLRSTDLSDFIQAYYFEGNGKHTLIIWNEVVVLSQKIQVTLPGTNQRVWNVKTGAATETGETSTYTLKEGESLQFFTWENTDLTQPPRIAAQ